eukprot:39224-Amphidinium_carterae.1
MGTERKEFQGNTCPSDDKHKNGLAMISYGQTKTGCLGDGFCSVVFDLRCCHWEERLLCAGHAHVGDDHTQSKKTPTFLCSQLAASITIHLLSVSTAVRAFGWSPLDVPSDCKLRGAT